MNTCSLCAEALDPTARSCPRCGIAAPAAAPRGRRVAGRVLRTAAAALAGAAALAVLAIPLVRSSLGGAGCEPQSWGDWHDAMERSCLTPAYVCEHMTSANLLSDPELAAELNAALRDGRGGAYEHLRALVGHVRQAYGCEGGPDDARGPPAPDPRLPPGHPPIPGPPGSPSFDAPSAVTI